MAKQFCELWELAEVAYDKVKEQGHATEAGGRSPNSVAYMQTSTRMYCILKEFGGSPTQRAKYGEEGSSDGGLSNMLEGLQ